jgi:hypothetical protein
MFILFVNNRQVFAASTISGIDAYISRNDINAFNTKIVFERK